MRKKGMGRLLAACLSLSMAVTSVSALSMLGVNANAATTVDSDTKLTDVLDADDISLRYKWDDTSNVGTERTVTIKGGTTATMKVKDNGTMRTELSSQYLAENEMGTGINLGNTMEATLSSGDRVTGKSATDFEQAWGAPVTTQEYIDCVHSYGINTLRIPVAWSNMVSDDGTYTIDESYLGRVEEIVNYALNDGMYVIINDHWDSQWWGQFGACTKDADGNKVANETMRAEAWKRYESYWNQISTRFKDYSDHLIFEGANEELGDRLNDAICANGYAESSDSTEKAVSGNLSSDELYAMVNKINQKFVDIVRATGGNNTYRHLLIPGYDTDITDVADDRYIMPTDPVTANGTSKMFLSVHYYTPWDFCGDGGSGKYTVGDQAKTKEYFAMLSKFKDAGYAVIVGECGVCNPSGAESSVTQWFSDTFTEAQKYDAVPVLWDTGAYFDRANTKLLFKDIAVFYNTVNGAKGDTSMTDVTGADIVEDEDSSSDYAVGDYIDTSVWAAKGIHAYLSFQTKAWDYRNAYTPLRKLDANAHSYEYIKASGNEITTASTVKDVVMTQDGEYTVSIDGIDLSGATAFNMLSVATDLSYSTYLDSNVTVSDVTIKFDGNEVTTDKVSLPAKTDDQYYNFMAINTYDNSQEYPLQDANLNETLAIPTKSVEITFTISGLDKVMQDIQDGTYINPATGLGINEVVSTDTTVGGKVGSTFASGAYQYKVTKAATSSKNGTVALTGLTKKGAAASKVTVANTVKNSKATYTVSAIGTKVFKGAKATSITLNKNITVIPASAFANCKKLKTLTVNGKLSKVASKSFAGCKNTIKVKGASKAANVKKLKKSGYKKFK